MYHGDRVFYACGTELEGNLEPSTRCTAAYAAVGIGSWCCVPPPGPCMRGLKREGD